MKTKAPDQILLEKIKNRSVAVAIIGMGFIGSTLGQLIAKKEFHVLGIFRKKAKAIAFEKKKIPHFHATCDSSELTKADIVIITVPTLVDKKKNRPDLGPLRQTAALLKKYTKAGRLVILESTVSHGMTRDIFDLEQNFIGFSPD